MRGWKWPCQSFYDIFLEHYPSFHCVSHDKEHYPSFHCVFSLCHGHGVATQHCLKAYLFIPL
jgi:hypothetical protein